MCLVVLADELARHARIWGTKLSGSEFVVRNIG